MTASTIGQGAAETYPVNLRIDYPEPGLSRLKTFFRLILAIPIVVLLGFLVGYTRFAVDIEALAGILFLPTLLMILFRRKYPKWWFDWNVELTRFENRVTAYLSMLRDEYPSTDDEQAVHLAIPYPDAHVELNRWLPLVKWLLAIPHYFLLFFLDIAATLAVIVSWFAILITGRYPRALFDFVVGVMRWNNRVLAYTWLLTTDKYPPFRLSA